MKISWLDFIEGRGQSYGFSSSYVWMWDLAYKESWAQNWCFLTVVLKKTLESPLDCKEIKPVNPKGNQPWLFIERTNAKAEAPILWPPNTKNWLFRNAPDAGKYWRQEEKGRTGDEMVGWHHWLDGHESEQALGVGDGQGGLACCWGCKELDTTEQMNWTELNDKLLLLYPGALILVEIRSFLKTYTYYMTQQSHSQAFIQGKWKYVHTKTWTQMFVAALFIIAKTGDNPKVLQLLNG